MKYVKIGTTALGLLGIGALATWGDVSHVSPSPKFIKVEESTASPAPSGYLTITFDDASLSQYQNGLRIAQEFGIVGTLFVSTAGVEAAGSNSDQWSMNWSHVNEFALAGWEIGAHTHTHPNMTTLAPDQVDAELAEAHRLIKERTGVTPVSYASPFGQYNEAVVAAAAKYHPYHLMAWGGNEGRNPIQTPDPSYIGRMDIPVTASAETVCGEMLQAAVQGTWTVLIFHGIVEGEPLEYEVSVDNFREMMHCASQLQEHGMIDVVTVEQAMSLMLPVNN